MDNQCQERGNQFRGLSIFLVAVPGRDPKFSGLYNPVVCYLLTVDCRQSTHDYISTAYTWLLPSKLALKMIHFPSGEKCTLGSRS